MVDFGVPTFVLSKYGGQCFSPIRLNRVPVIKIWNNVIIDDPDHLANPHFCDPVPKATADAVSLDRKTRRDIHVTDKRPREAHDGAVAVAHMYCSYVCKQFCSKR